MQQWIVRLPSVYGILLVTVHRLVDGHGSRQATNYEFPVASAGHNFYLLNELLPKSTLINI